MFVKAKQSGELLTRQPDELWSPDGVLASADKIQRVHQRRSDYNLEGLLVVSGAGNIVRGNELRDQGLARGIEDVLGRLATIQNTLMLASALENASVPTKMFVADSMGYSDPTIGAVDPYDVEAELQAYQHERVVLVAGGTGEDNKTTDNAVLEYGNRHRIAWPEDEVVILKGTKYDGVYTKDPKEHGDAQRFSRISAAYMLEHYEEFCVVDPACLDQIVRTGLSMRVYADREHDLVTAIAGNGNGVGTLIVPEDGSPVLAA